MPLLSALLFIAQKPWETYTLDGLTLALPVKPERHVPEVAPKEMAIWTAEPSEGGHLFMMVTPLEGKVPGDVSAGSALSEFLKGTGGRINAEGDTMLAGWPGLTASIATPDGATLQFAAYATTKSLFTVVVGGKGEAAAAFGGRILKSVAFAPSIGKGPLGSVFIST